MSRHLAALCAVLLVAGCGAAAPAPEPEAAEPHADGAIALSAEQIAAADIGLAQPTAGGAGAAIEAPGLLESDPEATRIVAAPLEGRVVALTRNLGDPVRRGETLAVIESRAAAALSAEVERAGTRAGLARSTLARDQALHDRGFRTRRDLDISRAAAEEAEVALRLARQQVTASGVRGGSLNRIVIVSPISGRVIARRAMLGQVFAADAAETELFRVADLGRLSLALSLSPADAARIRPGAAVELASGPRRASARIRFVSPVLDGETRLVRVIAVLDNSAGLWRAGEPVQARIQVAAETGGGQVLMIPAAAVQMVEDRSVVFVRTPAGFRVTPVTLGRRDGPLVAVTAGLAGNETVAARNSFVLKAELGRGEAEHGGH
ncbi:MAG TPA: efflux RND transporter periplasmic adaptor subunit [Allosphingosinicella sp.]|nr:efflux RND transporter periplasmic adaptor subunit [Allosphingosinicella sp.]